uniref:Secreted protein n=1 Tax=Strongyloides venezuelensis TaxID=75913 RepID=A0A0K0G5U2_STRVS
MKLLINSFSFFISLLLNINYNLSITADENSDSITFEYQNHRNLGRFKRAENEQILTFICNRTKLEDLVKEKCNNTYVLGKNQTYSSNNLNCTNVILYLSDDKNKPKNLTVTCDGVFCSNEKNTDNCPLNITKCHSPDNYNLC